MPEADVPTLIMRWEDVLSRCTPGQEQEMPLPGCTRLQSAQKLLLLVF